MFSQQQTNINPMKDFEVNTIFLQFLYCLQFQHYIQVTNVPEDTVSAMEFSPPTLQQNFLIAGNIFHQLSFQNPN
jgi:hypothetical protein